MALALKSICILIVCVLALSSARGAGSADDKLKYLAEQKSWLRLLHIKPSVIQVRSPGFYLSSNSSRHIDSLAELKLNLEQAQYNPKYRCEFPARDQWFKEHFAELQFASGTCTELEAWHQKLAIQSVSIVYPNHSLASPLSVFSHTFLKFNSAKYPVTSNLNLALGFAAEFSPEDTLVKLALLGVFGGYRGRYTLSNYYTEINRYGEGESRDIFEYELALTPAEVKFLLNHLWEIQNADFKYFFLNGNCSYHLLTLLEVVRPELDLSSHSYFVTVPLTSLKIVLEQKNLLRSEHWLPSKQTRQNTIVKTLSSKALAFYQNRHQREQPQDLKVAFEQSHLKLHEQMKVLELLAESTRGKTELEAMREQVLILRSRLPTDPNPVEPPLPEERPHKSHGAQAAAIGAGHNHAGAFGQLRYRFVLHSLLDPPQSYFRNTNLEVGDLRLRYGPKQWDSSTLTLFNILILKPWSDDPHLSWQARSKVFYLQEQVQWQNDVGVGVTKSFNGLNLYTLAIADSFIGAGAESGVWAGISVGSYFDLFKKLRVRANLDHLWPMVSNQSNNIWQGEMQLGYTISTNWSLQTAFANSSRDRSVTLELLRYF